MTEQEKLALLKGLSDESLAHRYQQFINYLIEGAKTGIIDKTEYRVFQEQTMKRDISALAHAYLSMVFTFEDYWNKITTIVGWSLMIEGIIDGNIKAKSNGQDDNLVTHDGKVKN